MTIPEPQHLRHPNFHRREFLQAGALATLGGLSLADIAGLRAGQSADTPTVSPPKSVIYIVLTGGLAQHESFDPKPDAPAEIRGEFNAIATQTPGLFISEHLPLLAARSNKWALCRADKRWSR